MVYTAGDKEVTNILAVTWFYSWRYGGNIYIGCKVVSTAGDKEVTNILPVRWFIQLEIMR